MVNSERLFEFRVLSFVGSPPQAESEQINPGRIASGSWQPGPDGVITCYLPSMGPQTSELPPDECPIHVNAVNHDEASGSCRVRAGTHIHQKRYGGYNVTGHEARRRLYRRVG